MTNDAEFVEDLSIRHVDEQFGPHSGHFESFEDYGRRRDECMSHLFQAVARNDGVTVDQVRAALNQRPLDFDVATILSFVIIYSWVANAIAFRIWRSHGLDFGVRHAKIISVYAAILLGLAFVMAGEGWCDTMETIRHGNGHQSYRGERVPWTHHHYLEYVSGVAIFCGIAILQQRAARLDTSSTLAGESHPIAG